MLRRSAMDKLERWKLERTSQGLLVDGARQVGKTTLVREFARNNYQSVAEVNFYENRLAVSTVSAATDARDLLLRISALSRTAIEPGKTLIFLDEVQECEDLLTWVKFLADDHGLDVILSGSLLGLDSFPARSLPVGFLNTLTMYPLTFEEFCWADGISDALLQEVRDCVQATVPIPDYLHQIMTDAFYRYLMVGGLPDAAQAYVNANSLLPARNVQAGVYDLYLHDVSKYVRDKTESRQIRMVLEAIPGQLNKQNKRFQYARLGRSLRFANLETAFDWLGHAGVALSVTRVTEPLFPLGLSEERGSLKLYMNDVGLLTSRLTGDVDLELLNKRSAINFGSIFENVAAQEMIAQGFDLHYYNSADMGEVDFVLETPGGVVFPCEIKSGKDYRRHSALNNLLQVENYGLQRAYVFCDGNVELRGKVLYLPIYCLFLLRELVS